MDTKNTSRQLRYLEEVRTPLHRAERSGCYLCGRRTVGGLRSFLSLAPPKPCEKSNFPCPFAAPLIVRRTMYG